MIVTMRTTKPNVCQLRSAMFVLLMILNLSASQPLEEGSPCDSKDEVPGTCVVVPECPPAIVQLRAQHRHDFPRCGFTGKYEIVCCPDEDVESKDGKENPRLITSSTSTTTTTTTTSAISVDTTTSKALVRGPVISKSVEVCEELMERFGITQISPQILGGVDANPGEFPHMAALGYASVVEDAPKIVYNCGGTLISDRFVLTAMHCLISQSFGEPVRVRMGMTNLTGTEGIEFGVKNITRHSEYDRRRRINDIALIEVDRVVTFTANLHPACLYTKPDDPKGLVVTGWGHLQFVAENASEVLQKGLLMPVDIHKCNETYKKIVQTSIFENQMCAISSDGKTDACQGDSGGPLQIAGPASNLFYVIGVTSFGRGCGGTYPGVYVRVSSYISWIEKTVWPK